MKTDFLCHSRVFVALPNHHLSVATVYGKHLSAVVLTGGDGSLGVQLIKDEGGMVIAQNRTTSQDFSKPKSSIKTGAGDFILPLEKISAKLTELASGSGS